MISAAKDAPIDIFYGIPSSVPSTSEKLETTGGVIDFEAMKHLLDEKDVVCVGEIMNYREIIRENHQEISKFLDYLRQENDKLRDKIAQIRLVDRAKCYLIEHKGMSEAEAHRMIEKTAMDTRRDRAEVAAEILEEE